MRLLLIKARIANTFSHLKTVAEIKLHSWVSKISMYG